MGPAEIVTDSFSEILVDNSSNAPSLSGIAADS